MPETTSFTALAALTGDDNYFEDFEVGQRIRHTRGRTVSNQDNLRWTLSTLNTAQAHFNLPYSQQLLDGTFEERLVMGGCTIALVVGLTSEDVAENATRDVAMRDIRLSNPVFRGDTLTAESEVLALEPVDGYGEVGRLTYRFTGTNQRGQQVVTGERTIDVRRRPACEESA